MDEYRLRFFAAHAYATQMSLFNSLSSPSLSQALTAGELHPLAGRVPVLNQDARKMRTSGVSQARSLSLLSLPMAPFVQRRAAADVEVM